MQSSAVIADLKPTDIARRLGLSRSYAFDLIKGHKTPSLDVAVKIEREFGIPASAWIGRAGRENAA